MDIQRRALRLMDHLDHAQDMDEVKRVDPRDFKQLQRDKKTVHDYQVRVNRQYRIRFNIVDEELTDLEIVDVQLKDFH